MGDDPDQLALRLVYDVLGKDVDEQKVIDIVNLMMNEGVVFRMAQWYIEEYLEQAGRETKTVTDDVCATVSPPTR
jgi:hypothetical protein